MPALSGAAAGVPDGHVQPAPLYAGAGSMLLAQPGTGEYEAVGAPAQGDRDGHRRRRWLLWGLAALLVACAAVAAVLLTGPGRSVIVPSVTGQTEQAAGATLRRGGLDPVPSLASSAIVPTGLVIRQRPAAGTPVKKGTRVSIVVSGGPASVPLIDVAGLSAAKAEAELRKAHFKTRIKAEPSKTVEAGLVIGSEPSAETEVQEGRVITLLVSSGPAPVRVPDVTGQSIEAAEATLSNAELAVGTVTKRVSSTQAPGTVLEQSPTPGGSVRAGEKVNLTVAQAPKEVAVPNVVGAAEAAAAAALKHAGFKSRTEKRPTSEQSQVGAVLEQSPSGGARARKGATVTMVVGVLSPTTTTPTTSTPTTTTGTTTTTAPTPPAGE